MLALGDMTERALRLIGITKERVTAIAGRDCGCKRRQRSMNEAGYVWQGKLLVPFRRVFEYCGSKWRSIRYTQAGQRLQLAGHHLWIAGRVLFYGY